MSDSLSFNLLNWYAWTPFREGNSYYGSWDQELPAGEERKVPQVRFVPQILRRRLSRLSRMMLYVSDKCVPRRPSGLRTVFASQHGEIHRTATLLEEMFQSGIVSPAAFSLSVHNTGAGLYSIATKDSSPSTSLAAGKDTFACALLDTWGWLQCKPTEPVLLVAADEPLPEVYSDFSRGEKLAAAAFLFKSDREDLGRRLNCRIEFGKKTPDIENTPNFFYSFLSWLSGGDESLKTGSRYAAWYWEKN